MQPLLQRWSVCDCVYDCENGHGRRNRIRHVRDGDVHDRDRVRRSRNRRVRDGDVRGYGRGRRNRIHRVRDDDHGYDRVRRNRIRHVRDGDVRGNDRVRRNRIHRGHESGHVHMNKSSFLRSYLSPLSVHQMHDAHFKYFFNMIVVKAVKYMLADLS